MQQRRNVINLLLGSGVTATLAAIVYPILQFIMPPTIAESLETAVTAGRLDEMPPNSGKIFQIGSSPGILVRTAEGDWRAYSARCTHLNCTVAYDPDQKLIVCACHNGVFDLEGKNVSGPPPRPLEPFTVNVRGDDVIVSRV